MIMGMCIGCSPYNAEQSVITQVIAVLRRFGTDAHIYLPGVGMLNGLQAGNYLDSSGTTAATVDQPVGLVLDAAGSTGVELVTNGDFSNGATGWGGSAVVSSGVVTITATGGYIGATQTLPGDVLTGKTVLLEYTVVSNTLNVNTLHIGGAAGRLLPSNGPIIPALIGKNQTLVTCSGSGNAFWLQVNNSSTSGQLVIDNISVREVTGIHAQQPTTSAKPILRRGAVNLLTYSGDFSNGAWGKSTVTVVGTLVKPSVVSGVKILFSASAAAQASNSANTVAFTASEGGYENLQVVFNDATNSNRIIASVNLATGSFLAAGGVTVSVAPLSLGYLVSVNYTSAVTTNNLQLRVAETNTLSGSLFAGNDVSGINIYTAALFQGTYTAQQIQALGGIPTTLTAPVSTALGAYWWDTSGSKSLVATFPAGNESVTVINATPTGQVTTTAQNVVGAYSINTNTNGRIIVNGVLTASELALLQSYANRLAGL